MKKKLKKREKNSDNFTKENLSLHFFLIYRKKSIFSHKSSICRDHSFLYFPYIYIQYSISIFRISIFNILYLYSVYSVFLYFQYFSISNQKSSQKISVAHTKELPTRLLFEYNSTKNIGGKVLFKKKVLNKFFPAKMHVFKIFIP